MKIPSQPHPCAGSVLLIAVGTVVVIGIFLGGYLWLVRTQNLSVTRSQSWNAALVLAESGVEEALAQLNPHNLNLATGTIDKSANGWTYANSAYGPVQRTLVNGTYSVVISGDEPPVITSVGSATVPAATAAVTRTVQVVTVSKTAFQVAVAARNGIDFSGNNVRVDSYDSTDPNYSLNGLYDPTRPKAGGDVASLNGPINIQNGDIKGRVLTGPNVSPPSLNNGEVGDLNWNTKGQIEPGWYRNDFNYDFKDVTEPYNSASPGVLVPGQYPLGDTNKYVLGTGKYLINGDLVLNSGDALMVSGKATLYVTGNVVMKSSGNSASAINIVSTTANLKIFVAGASATFQQVNTVGNASTFQYYGLPGNLSLSWSGNSQYLGTIYAPEALFNLGGGGNNLMDFQGSCVVNAVSINGKFNFHFDENLRRDKPAIGYQVASWREL